MRITWRLWLALTSALLFGVAGGVLVTVSIFMSSAEGVAADMARKQARLGLLESLVLNTVGQNTAALDTQTPPAAASHPVVVDRAAPEPRVKAAAREPKPKQERKPEPSQSVSITKAVVPAPAPAAAAAATPAAPTVTGDELIEALKSKIEGVSAAKSGVRHIDRKGVDLANGTRILLGQRFPSGEKLLSTDFENSRIVTDKRQILVFGLDAVSK